MTIKNIVFNDLNEEDLSKWDFGILKEDGKHPLKFLWLESYERDFRTNTYSRQCHLLECSSRGTLTLDGERLKDSEDLKKGTAIFNLPIFGK